MDYIKLKGFYMANKIWAKTKRQLSGRKYLEVLKDFRKFQNFI